MQVMAPAVSAFQAGHEGSIPFARSNPKPQLIRPIRDPVMIIDMPGGSAGHKRATDRSLIRIHRLGRTSPDVPAARARQVPSRWPRPGPWWRADGSSRLLFTLGAYIAAWSTGGTASNDIGFTSAGKLSLPYIATSRHRDGRRCPDPGLAPVASFQPRGLSPERRQRTLSSALPNCALLRSRRRHRRRTASPAPRSGLMPRSRGRASSKRDLDRPGGSSPLPDCPASSGTRRERFASPPAMACGHPRQNPAESRRYWQLSVMR
jgi:hypothetical protein